MHCGGEFPSESYLKYHISNEESSGKGAGAKWRRLKSGEIRYICPNSEKFEKALKMACYFFVTGDFTMFKKRLSLIISRTETTSFWPGN